MAALSRWVGHPQEKSLRDANAEQARVLSAILSGSQALASQLQSHSDWLSDLMDLEGIAQPRRPQGLSRELQESILSALEAKNYTAALGKVRLFKQQNLLRVGARDLAKLGSTPQILQEISDVADVCLSAVFEICRRQTEEKFGRPWHQDPENRWQQTEFCVIGLGKLGGQELNYSSDVDVIFVYSEEGYVFKHPPKKSTPAPAHSMTSHQYFKRLAEAFIAEVLRSTSEGILYRIDLRLRPEGDAGPLVRSLSSYENFYAQWGQTWERMMLIKARRVAGDVNVSGEFLEMVQPFRYPRSMNENVLKEISAMKDRIESEVVRSGELERNVKLGRGGIREVEFIAQSLQLLNGGRLPFLQGAQTLPALQKLVQYKLMEPAEAKTLAQAYCFLRDVEHRVQMENNLQSHTIPAEKAPRERLARLMGYATLQDFEKDLRLHTADVRRAYDKILRSRQQGGSADGALPSTFKGAEQQWTRFLGERSFKDIEKSIRLLNEFANGPGYGHVSSRTTELAFQLLPKFFALCRRGTEDVNPDGTLKRTVLSDPDRVLARLDSFVSAYGARAMLFETWSTNANLFELLLMLFDRSEFLAEIAIRTPDLVDELVLSGRLRRGKSAEETLEDLRHGLGDEDQKMWIRRYHQSEFMRIGLRDILGLADFEQNLAELSALAEACLRYALEAVLRAKKIRKPPLTIVGLGKLGGAELTYGSDLDIIFVANPGEKHLPRLQKLAAEVMELLSAQTEHGIVFVTDARLRPDGEKGLLVNTLDAYEEYYRHRAQLWEIQALTRARPIAGDAALGTAFEKMAAPLIDFSPANVKSEFPPRTSGAKSKPSKRSRGLHCFAPDWKKQIAHMRGRVEKERTPAGQDALAIKTGRGGLMDVEFLAQAICLENGWMEGNSLRALTKAGQAKLSQDSIPEKLLASYRKLRRVEGILRRWSFEGETVLPHVAAPFYRVAVRCGYASVDAFAKALAEWRKDIREGYSHYFHESMTG